jgi:DNA-binding LacI/PurR family transcriptional regulator
VPEDISVVGFDDVPEAAYFTPPLTTVRQDFDEVGKRGMALLLAQIHGDHQQARKRARIRPTLELRASTGAARS